MITSNDLQKSLHLNTNTVINEEFPRYLGQKPPTGDPMNKRILQGIGDVLTISFVLGLFFLISLVFLLDVDSMVIIYMLLPIISGIVATKVSVGIMELHEQNSQEPDRKETDDGMRTESPVEERHRESDQYVKSVPPA